MTSNYSVNRTLTRYAGSRRLLQALGGKGSRFPRTIALAASQSWPSAHTPYGNCVSSLLRSLA